MLHCRNLTYLIRASAALVYVGWYPHVCCCRLGSSGWNGRKKKWTKGRGSGTIWQLRQSYWKLCSFPTFPRPCSVPHPYTSHIPDTRKAGRPWLCLAQERSKLALPSSSQVRTPKAVRLPLHSHLPSLAHKHLPVPVLTWRAILEKCRLSLARWQ